MKIRTIMLFATAIFFLLAIGTLVMGDWQDAIVLALLGLICKPVDQPPGMQAKVVDTEH